MSQKKKKKKKKKVEESMAMIFLSRFLDILRMSLLTVSLLAQLGSEFST